MTSPVLQVEDLRTYFRSGSTMVRAVDGVSFEVHSGETLGIVGESGSGKSVTAMSVMRLVESPPGHIVSGRILLDQEDLRTASEARMRSVRGKDIGMIFQDPMTSLNPTMTVGAQIMEPLTLHLKMSSHQARQRAVELLEGVGIPEAQHRMNEYPHQFSGGMRQRVMIAIAMSCVPRVLIADEPTTALDVTIQAQILELMKTAVAEHGTALLLISHDMGVIAGICSRVVVMYGGTVVEQATTRELFANPRHPYTQGLLRSVPRLDGDVEDRLATIPGQPPNLAETRDACPFAPRCERAAAICHGQRPELRRVDDDPEDHLTACWFPIGEREPLMSRSI